MKVDVIKITPIDSEGPTAAFADVVIDGRIKVYGLRVVNGKNGMFVSMPQRKNNDKWYDIVHLVDEADRRDLSESVLAAINGGSSAGEMPF